MKQLELGKSGIVVSDWSLGNMTFGNQTDEAEGFRQLDMARAAGITFFDTAEMYPVNPVTPESVGRSEEFLGRWLAARGRGDAVIATKVTGVGRQQVRGGEGFDSKIIRRTLEDSLRRLQLETIDIYQTHWPQRGSYAFRQNWSYDPSGQDPAGNIAHMDGVLGTLKDLQREGKIRAFGLSNESAWGTTRWVDRADAQGAPRVLTIQNEYSLLNRLFDTDLAEVAVNEGVTLLAYSPLAAGLLTGKYQNGAIPAGSRRSLVADLGGRVTPRVFDAVQAYLDIAAGAGLDPVQMALAWLRSRPFPLIPILGATTAAQLEVQLAGYDLRLSSDVLDAIEQTHRAHAMPF
ncbi:aldo/keto reductase [Ketogulonicigenium vulgare]|uniref:Oxidoreductase, aldo/keto reductase family protein n=1 Tax=Ketogulonicigenium vulgare (strain WSH-001) TaxID=759362 RepID=F9Y3D6_KETVW|nr:aldo/keto reductase [Ketogulonicigenium vulgare]ADO42172.1 oxidoreductase, aldo/keto reductase family protein [Ketogulonicigenium vulgare Y25]AEM40377.1 Oxidoreductase, aldo/keto reductase family protein [Ketogulonicigenium vulgare WSH-001]ALJ80565.1 aldo/keto reductase [Ketogulonicigenium vulgare]ANW33386.1 aldo/keto reductase [Ketogulonicigenium vulgare]AOZ54090.1 oxidoreductase, aldo/keto reductase family protein [Ketogulonicigenium vulgare]